MRIELPNSFERFGNVIIHSKQKIFAMDAGPESSNNQSEKYFVVKKITNEQSWNVEKDMAIIIPIKDEKLKLLEGVITGIPHNCAIIIVSNSSREDSDRFEMEKNVVDNICHFAKRNYIIVHQKDPDIANLFSSMGYDDILDEDGLVKNGKSEGMMIGLLITHLLQKKYIGFIDSDNYFPGSVFEYVRIFSSIFTLAKTDYTLGRILWHSKPKAINSNILFSKWGRVSRLTNFYLNRLISIYSGFETDIINTANSGEHCISMKLATNMDFGAGFTVEPYNFINLFEKFGNFTKNNNLDLIHNKVINIHQVESRNPHLHESKGNEHVNEMIDHSLGSIYNSDICPSDLKKEILKELKKMKIIVGNDLPVKRPIYKALNNYNTEKAKILFDPEIYGSVLVNS